MVPVANTPPDVPIVVVLDRYCQPGQLSMVVPLITALIKQYPESHKHGQIRMASVTFDTTQTNEMLNPLHWFESVESMLPRYQSKEACLSKFGIRPGTGAKGKGAMVEGIVAGMELFKSQANEGFVDHNPPGPPVPSHTKLRSFADSKLQKHMTNPVRHMVLLSALLPDTGARAIRNKYTDFDGCAWGQLPEKLKQLNINLSVINMNSAPKIAELHAAATPKPSEVWFNRPPHFPHFQMLLAGFDTKVLSQSAPNANTPAKRPTPESDMAQSPNSKRARNSTDASAGPHPPLQPPASSMGQPPSVTNPPHPPSQNESAPVQVQSAPANHPAPSGLAGRRLAAPHMSLPPLPAGPTGSVPAQIQLQNAAPAQPSVISAVPPPNVPAQWQSVLAMNNQNGSAAAANGPMPQPSSVVLGATAKQPPAGTHSRSASIQGIPNAQNRIAAPASAQLPAPLFSGAQQANVNISGHARSVSTNAAAPGQTNPSAGGQQVNNLLTQSASMSLPSPRAHPPGTLYPFPPTPPPVSVDLNDPETIKRALDKVAQDYFQQLPPALQQRVKTELAANNSSATVEDISRARALAVLGGLGVTARKLASPKHERMHQSLYELVHARWPRQSNMLPTGPPSVGNVPPSVNAGPSQPQQPAPVPSRPESTVSNAAALQAQQKNFLLQQHQKYTAALQAQMAQQAQAAQHPLLPAQSTPPPPDSPHIPLSSQVPPRQLPRPGAVAGHNQMRNSPILGENQSQPSITRPSTTQPHAQVQQQAPHMQQMPAQGPMAMVQQNMQPQIQQSTPMATSSQGMPMQQPGGVQISNQGQGAPRLPFLNTEALRDIAFTWKSDTGQNLMVFAGVGRLNRQDTRVEAIQQLLRSWPDSLHVPAWFASRFGEKTYVKKLMEMALALWITPVADSKLGDKAQFNQNMFQQFNDMFQRGARLAYIPVPMNGRQDTGLVLMYPPIPKDVKMVMAICFHDRAVPPQFTGPQPSNVLAPMISQNPAMLLQLQQAQLQQQQQPQQQPQQQAMVNGRPGLPMVTEEQRQAYLRMLIQAQTAQAQAQAQVQARNQASNQGLQQPQQQITQPGQPQPMPHQTPQQQVMQQQAMQRTTMQAQVQPQQLAPQQQPQLPQQQPQLSQQQPQLQQQGQRSRIIQQMQQILRMPAPPPGTNPEQWQQQKQWAQQTLMRIRQTQLQAANGMQGQAPNQVGVRVGMQSGPNGMAGNMGGVNNAAMTAMQNFMMNNNGGMGQQAGMGGGMPGGPGNGMNINQTIQNMFNQPLAPQNPSGGGGMGGFNAQQLQQAMAMGGLNMGGVGVGNMTQQQQGGFNTQGGGGGQGMIPMNLAGFGMQQQQGQQVQGGSSQISLDLLQAYIRNNKEGSM